jgi:hypothetical protein
MRLAALFLTVVAFFLAFGGWLKSQHRGCSRRRASGGCG